MPAHGSGSGVYGRVVEGTHTGRLCGECARKLWELLGYWVPVGGLLIDQYPQYSWDLGEIIYWLYYFRSSTEWDRPGLWARGLGCGNPPFLGVGVLDGGA